MVLPALVVTLLGGGSRSAKKSPGRPGRGRDEGSLDNLILARAIARANQAAHGCWTLQRAARLGYLAGRGLSLPSIMADDVIAARSQRSVRVAATRLGVPIGRAQPLALVLPGDASQALDAAAASRGMSSAPWRGRARKSPGAKPGLERNVGNGSHLI